MAKRLCFFIENEHVIERYVDFNYVKGLAFSQKVKCALSLQNAIINQYPKSKPIEISSKSSCELGKSLSAFSLKLDGRYIESIFQSSKVFSESGQLEFLKDYSPRDAKHYIKENGKGNITCFSYEGVKYPIYPESAFYDWIYIHALDNSSIKKDVLDYDVFTDIEFNDKKSINCQARSVAIYVAMCRVNKKDYYLSSFNNFIELYKLIEKDELKLV